MPTPAERKALLFLSGVIFLGASVRVVRAARDEHAVDPTSRAALERQIAAVDSAAEAPRARHRARPRRPTRSAAAGGVRSPAGAELRGPSSASAGPGPPTSGAERLIDLDAATAVEIEALPRIGPVLAQRIVEDRGMHGPFGSMDGLQRVRGVGPALARTLAPWVTFSGTARPASAVVHPGPRSSSSPVTSPRRRPRG